MIRCILIAVLVCIGESVVVKHIDRAALAHRWEPNASVAGNITGFQAAFEAEWKHGEGVFWNDLERCSKAEQIEIWACNLPVCKNHGDNAPTLYTTERGDGVGGRMISTLLTMDLADRLGMNFGGLVLSRFHKSHGVNFMDVLDTFFGIHEGGGIHVSKGFHFDHVMKDVDVFNMSAVNNSDKVVVDPYIFQYEGQQFIHHDFLSSLQRSPQLLRSKLMTMPLKFNQSKLNVAIHLRRGDIGADEWRSTPDDFYFKHVELIRSLQPDADIHVFSSLETRWKSADFDGFRERGMHVHLDTDMGVPETWAHMANAHLLIMAKSSFAYVPAYVNSHCAVHLDYFFPRASAWH